MNWKKSLYLITCQDEEGKFRLLVEGIKTNIAGFEIGIHKEESGVWIITDISTGYKMHIAATQKAAKAWTEGNSEIIKEILSKETHKQIEEEVKRCSRK